MLKWTELVEIWPIQVHHHKNSALLGKSDHISLNQIIRMHSFVVFSPFTDWRQEFHVSMNYGD